MNGNNLKQNLLSNEERLKDIRKDDVKHNNKLVLS
jgi:hypothetical protein